MLRLPLRSEGTGRALTRTLLDNEGQTEGCVRIRIYNFSLQTLAILITYSLECSSVTSEYADFRTFIAILRILDLDQIMIQGLK